MSPAPVHAKRSARDWLIGILLVVATLVVYLPALRGGFIWNDDDYVTARSLQSWSGLARIWFEVGATEQYYPLLHSAFWLQHRLWGDSPVGYHLVNVLLHAGNALLLVVALRRLAIPGAWLAGFLFALHPVCVESAAWIAEQKNTLSTFFYLLAAIAYFRFDASRRPSHYLLATALFVAALLSKSLTATLVGALLVVFWWRRGRIAWRRDVVPLLPWFVLGAAAGLFTGWVERTVLRAEGADFALSILQRVLLAGRVVWFYLGKLVWPGDLIFIYPRWEIRPDVPAQYLYLLCLVLVLIGLWWLRGRDRAPLAALLFFIGSLFPVSGFFNVYGFLFSYVADHWQYLPCIGILVFAAAGFVRLAERYGLTARTQGAVAILLLILLGLLSWRQTGLYRDIVTFYQRTIAANPACWMAYNNLGSIHAQAERWPEAVRNYEAALRHKPDRFEVHNNLGLAFVASGAFQEAVNHFERSIELNPRSFGAYSSIGTILRHAGRNAEAAQWYRKSIEVNPRYAEAYNNLGLTLIDLGQHAEAIATFEKALQLEPGDAQTHNNLGVALTNVAQFDAAERHFRRAFELAPDYAAAHDNFGNQLRKMRRLPQAIEEYTIALRLKPDTPVTLINLSIALTDAGRFAEAIEIGERAVRLAPNIPEAHFNLSLALLGAGRLQDARERYDFARKQKPTLPTVPALEAGR